MGANKRSSIHGCKQNEKQWHHKETKQNGIIRKKWLYISYFLANKLTRRMSRQQLLARKMRVSPYYCRISPGKTFDLRGAAPD